MGGERGGGASKAAQKHLGPDAQRAGGKKDVRVTKVMGKGVTQKEKTGERGKLGPLTDQKKKGDWPESKLKKQKGTGKIKRSNWGLPKGKG